MSSAAEYRAYADECFGWARTAKTDREREIFYRWPKLGLPPRYGLAFSTTCGNLLNSPPCPTRREPSAWPVLEWGATLQIKHAF